ncbi:hypothetical protein BGZ76_008148 [Entomortierella beljakovae]|nr:hypothetical protein BGZ76_008148 [Entomortierella beljakovae]
MESTISPQHSEEPRANLERCLELLKPSSTDEAKFIGLTLMSDILQTSQDLETMTRFFDSMDFGFLDRMMQIDEDSVPDDAGVDEKTIKAISIDIMTCFSTHWELLIRKEFKDRVPTMLGMLSSSDETENSKKILKIMLRISTYPQASMILTNSRYQSTIVAYILGSFQLNNETHEDAIQIFKRTFHIIQEGYKQNPEIVLKITRNFLPTIMTKLSKAFSSLTETHKSEILQLLTDSIAYLPETYVQQHIKEFPDETRIWTKNLKSGLIQLLSTRQAPATRDNLFKLTGLLLQRLGPEWIFPQTATPTLPKNMSSKKRVSPASLVTSVENLSLSDTDINKKFASLVIHLTCVEVRVLMDQLADDLIPTDERASKVFTTPEEIKQEKTRKEHVLPLSYEILEVSIGYLVNVAESEESLDDGLFDATGLLKVQESLQGAFSAILDYLKDLQTNPSTSPASLAANMIYLASLRILSVWLMEDDSLHAQAAALVPPLEAVIKHW